MGQKIDISEIEAYGPPPPSGSAPSRRSMLTGQAPPPPSDEVAPPPVKPAGPRSLLSPGLDALQDIIAGGAKEIPREAINILKNLYNTVGPGIGENIVSAMTGRPVPSNPVRDTVLETIGLPTARVPEPKPYGTYDEALQQTNLLQKGGGLAVELYGQSRIPGGRAITGGRVLRRVKTAAREGVIGGLTGVASSDDPITGSVGGTIGGLVVPGRTGQQLGEAAEAQVRAAAQRASQAIAPATKANKRWVARNWEQTVRQSRWFGGLEDLVEQAEGNVRAAGQRIDAVLAGVRQGNVSPQLRRAAAQISMGARALLTRAGTLGVELAPQTREAMENVVGALSRMNPRSTSLEALTAARDELTAAMRGLRGELGRRSAQITGAGAVRQAFDTAVTGGTVQGTRNLARLAQRTMRNVQRGVAPSRIRTQPLVNSLLSFRRTFEGVNDAGQAITHNAPGAGQVDDLIDQVRAYGSEMSVDQVRNVRQIWDKITAGATGKGFLSDIADESRRGATRSAANVVRGAIANQVPALVAPNRAFSFNRNLADVVGDTLERRTGQTKGPMAGVQAGIGTAIGSIGSLLLGLDFGGAGVAGASVGALLHYGTKLVKSPTFNLLNAKTRLAVAEAMRRGDTEALRFALRRAGIQLNVIAQNGEMPISTSTDMTDEEYQQQLQQLQTGGETLPGMSEEGVSPDDIQMPLPPNVSDPLGGDPLDPTQIDSTDLNPGEEEARAAQPEILRAGVGGGNLLQGAASLMEQAGLNRPLVDIPEWEGHPTINKIGAAIEQNLTPLDVGFAGSSLLRPLTAATRFARPVELVGRGLSGAVALQGAAGLQQGIETGNVPQALGGAVGLGFGGLGLRSGGAVPATSAAVKATAQRVAPLAQRLMAGLKAGGADIAVGPAIVASAATIMDTPAMRRAIPDDQTRAEVGQYLQLAGIVGTPAALMAKGGKAKTNPTIEVDGRTVEVVPHWTDRRKRMVWLDTAALDKTWSGSKGFYVGKGGGTNVGGIRDGAGNLRYDKFGEFLQTGKPMEAPDASVYKDGGIHFGNGRHRTAYLRDKGVPAIPVMMDAASERYAREHGLLAEPGRADTANEMAPPLTGRAARDAARVAGTVRNQAARLKAIGGYVKALPKDVRAALVTEITTAFPRLDSYSKPMHPVLPGRLLARAAGLSDEARGFIDTVVQGSDPKRPISPLELHALAAGKAYAPPRLIRPPLPSNYNFKKTLPGAPLGVTTRAHEEQRLASYLELVEEGKAGADWYDKGGKAMLSHVGDDPQAARELAAIHSVTSPATDVVVNSGFAGKGWNQQAVGDPIETGRYPARMSEEVRKVFAGTSQLMRNLKRGPFYQALARRGGFGDENVPLRPTNDIWQAEAWGYANPDGTPMRKGFNAPTHAWMDRMTQRAVDIANERALGGRTDWTLDRLQAAAWFGMKQRATAAEGKPPEPYADFETGLQQNYSQGGREAVPGTSTGHLAGVGDDPALKTAQDEAVYQATHDAQGRDRISLALGGLTGPSVRGPGVYEGVVSPGVQTQVVSGIQRGGPSRKAIHPSSMKLLNAIESTYALTYGQSMAAHGRFFSDAPAKFRNAISVKLGRVPTDAEFLQLGKDLQAAGFGSGDIAQIFGPMGYTLKGIHDDVGLQTPDQIKRLRAVAAQQGHRTSTPGFQSGNAIFNDWSVPGQEFGQRYFPAIEPVREQFDLAAPDIVARAQAADQQIIELTDGKLVPSENIERLRDTMATEGYAGLERIARRFGVSVVLLATAIGMGGAAAETGDE